MKIPQNLLDYFSKVWVQRIGICNDHGHCELGIWIWLYRQQKVSRNPLIYARLWIIDLIQTISGWGHPVLEFQIQTFFQALWNWRFAQIWFEIYRQNIPQLDTGFHLVLEWQMLAWFVDSSCFDLSMDALKLRRFSNHLGCKSNEAHWECQRQNFQHSRIKKSFQFLIFFLFFFNKFKKLTLSTMSS